MTETDNSSGGWELMIAVMLHLMVAASAYNYWPNGVVTGSEYLLGEFGAFGVAGLVMVSLGQTTIALYFVRAFATRTTHDRELTEVPWNDG